MYLTFIDLVSLLIEDMCNCQQSKTFLGGKHFVFVITRIKSSCVDLCIYLLKRMFYHLRLVCNVKLSHTDIHLISLHFLLNPFLEQCGPPHRADRGALQPFALSADDVRVAIRMLRCSTRVLRS